METEENEWSSNFLVTGPEAEKVQTKSPRVPQQITLNTSLSLFNLFIYLSLFLGGGVYVV